MSEEKEDNLAARSADNDQVVTVLGGSFTVIFEGKEKKAQCKFCSSKFKYHHSTSSLSYHLKAKHPFSSTTTSSDYASSSKTSSQQALSTMWETRKMTPNHENEITNDLVKWIARNSRPLNIVEDKGLEDLIKIASKCSTYKLPQRKTISQRIDDLFIAERAKVSELLNNSANIALTADYWSSRRNDSYLGITAHTLTHSWEIKCMALGITHSLESHTAENIKEQVKKLLSEWDIDFIKIAGISTDNAYNIVNAMKELNVNRIPCMAHTIQLSILCALKACDVDKELKKARNIVGRFKRVSQMKVHLNAAQAQQGKRPKSLVGI